jgi:cysteine-rich repeat protein
LICRGGRWQPNETCASDENCDAETGACAEIVEECEDREPGKQYCTQDTLIECGADLVSIETTECEGRCIEESGTARCATPFCSDGKIQPPERCDDGNTNSWDGCSAKCVVEVVALALGREHSCALGGNGRVKCWGENGSGQLGLGDLDARGDQPGEMREALPNVDLGLGRSAKAIAAIGQRTCAILDDDALKCWGASSGLGDEETRGDEPGEMGDALPAIDLGAARTVKSVSAGWGVTCALLDDLSVKCWGQGGVLGLGDPDPRGYKPNQMGNALPRVDLGTGRSAKFVSTGYYCGCAILDDDSLKCWGRNSGNQLGLPDGLDRGDEALEMGDQLPSVNLGTGRTATLVRTGHAAVCAILDDGSMKCWGTGPGGGLHFPQMGDTVPRVNLGLGRTAVDVGIGYYHFCALLDDGSVKCWGSEADAVSTITGYAPVGDSNSPPSFDLGEGRSARNLAVGGFHTCALLDDGSVRCWGHNGYGQLGIGRTGAYGMDPSERGDALIPVDLVF